MKLAVTQLGPLGQCCAFLSCNYADRVFRGKMNWRFRMNGLLHVTESRLTVHSLGDMSDCNSNKDLSGCKIVLLDLVYIGK